MNAAIAFPIGWVFIFFVIGFVVLAAINRGTCRTNVSHVSGVIGFSWTAWVVRWIVAVGAFMLATDIRPKILGIILFIIGCALAFKNVMLLLSGPEQVTPPAQPNPPTPPAGPSPAVAEPQRIVIHHERASRGFPWGGVVLGMMVAGALMFTGIAPRVAAIRPTADGPPDDRTLAEARIVVGESDTEPGEAPRVVKKDMNFAKVTSRTTGNSTFGPPPPPTKNPTVVVQQKGNVNLKASRRPTQPPQAREPRQVWESSAPRMFDGTRIPAFMTQEELLAQRAEETGNQRFVIESDPASLQNSATRDTLLERAEKILENHLYPKVEADKWIKPSVAWLREFGIIQIATESVQTSNGLQDRQVAILDVAPEKVEMVYNYHLGCVRTRNIAPVYFGMLMLLGGLALLVRLGTGVRPSAPPVRV